LLAVIQACCIHHTLRGETMFIKELCNDANDHTTHPNIEWVDSSYGNDACPSIMYDLDNDNEWYVQLFAFEDKEAAEAEGFDFIYATKLVKEGDIDWHNELNWSGDDKSEALRVAIAMAEQLQAEHLKRGGFEHEGVWIEDDTMSPCGRFVLTPEQRIETYFDEDDVCRNGKPIKECNCC